MKKILVFIVAVLAVVGIQRAEAQSQSSYFMGGTYFRTDLNPAFAPKRGYVALPVLGGVDVDVSNNFLSVNNFVFERDGGLVTAFHSSVSSEEFLKKMPNRGRLAMNMKSNILGVGFYVGNLYFNLGLNANVSTDASMSMDIFKAVKQLGNGIYDLGNTAFSANAYMDAYVGTSIRILRNLRVGARAKLLVGIANFSGDFNKLQVNVDPNVVNGVMSGQWRANGIFIDNSMVRAGSELPLNEVMRTDLSYIFSNFKNYGLAFDLGAEMCFLDNHLRVSAAVTDLGFICWGKKSHIGGIIDGEFNYSGMNIETSEIEASYDYELLVTDGAETQGYTSMLNCSLNIGAEYNILNDRIGFGLLSHTTFYNTMSYSELTASVNFRPLHWLSATVSHTFLNRNRAGIFGFALNLYTSGINIYAGMDYIDLCWVKGPTLGSMKPSLPRYAKSLNAYVGVGFSFGGAKDMYSDNGVKSKKAKKSKKGSDAEN